MEKLLIIAYMGTGKTWLESRYENVIDFDFQDLRTENPNYPMNFLDDAIKLLNEGKIVVSPFIDHVFKAYDSPSFKSRVNDSLSYI